MTLISDTDNEQVYAKKWFVISLRNGRLPMYTKCRYAIDYYYSYVTGDTLIGSPADYNKEETKEMIRVHTGYEKIKKAFSIDRAAAIKINGELEQIEMCRVIESDIDSEIEIECEIDDGIQICSGIQSDNEQMLEIGSEIDSDTDNIQ